MKKTLIVLLVAVLACGALFAGSGTSLGIMQNYFYTSVVLDKELENTGFEAAAGIPLITGIGGIIDYIANGGQTAEGEEAEAPNLLAMTLIPGLMVNGYWKVVDGKVFGLRLGLQADAIALMDYDAEAQKNYFSITGLIGISLGLNFKVNEKFSFGINGALPLAVALSALDQEDGGLANYTMFYYNTDPDKNAHWDVLNIIGAAINQFCRVTFKWSI